ncbi:SDR family oxidoreductase [Ottowia beijingensis]|uniref:SDR family oxidoreductase n=1 Tax=Ottowia beijingensis TaxID=1207057 RepID=A0A853IV13_9BURK|nr:SDR family NAD(P)-dependent oxidoreductase [Ottowia beijingensis]NZA01884.1 SDR family oxidoreductase [Ottowia beijingensis]
MSDLVRSTPRGPWDLAGKTVAVAGGGSVAPGWSIGRAACVTYARLGATVLVLDRDLSSAQETARFITEEGGEAYAYEADMAREQDIVDTFRSLAMRHAPLDVLHHNVGIGKTGGPMETSAEDLDRIHSVNVKSLMLSCQAVLPSMVERRTGVIISIASVAGLRYLGYPHLAYCTTKAAVIQMTRMIAQQYAPYGIRANTVIPGLIDTPRVTANVAHMFADNLDEAKAERARQVPMQRMGTAWEVANACAFLASDSASYITGTELLVDGGLVGKFV